MFSEIIADSSEDTPDSSATSELEKYLSDPVIDYKTGDPYQWWGQHKTEFPNLAILAKRFLCDPATSVPSERLFQLLETCMTKKEIECYHISQKNFYSYKTIFV